MMKALLVPILAAGLAMGGAAKPAKAITAEEAATILAGLAIVGVIASSSNNNSSNKARSSHRTPLVDGRSSARDFERRRILPAQCVRRFDTNRGVRNLAIERCLERNDVRVSRLPERCAVRVRTDRGVRDAFRQRCLENEGYRFRDTVARHDGRQGVRYGDQYDGRRVLDARRSRD
ncbi:MAG: hypothetical protein QNJ13_11815 [Paracoccaceae bacterium]|nr:hypothetical protein [Paracoccaceae bacterium]